MSAHDYRTLPEILREAAHHHALHTALVALAGPAPIAWTYAELERRAGNAAAALRALGVHPGDRVASLAEPGPAWVAAMFGVLCAGAVFVPLAADTMPDVAGNLCRHVGARFLITGSRPLADVEGVSSLRVSELIENGPAGDFYTETRPDDLAIIAFTSGSTRQPRAVELTHDNIASNVTAVLSRKRAAPGDTFLSLLPPHHMLELTAGLFAPLACGARIVYPSTVMPNRILDAMQEWQVTHAVVVPAFVRALFEEARDQWLETDISDPRALRELLGSTLRSLMVGGAAIDPAWASLCESLGINVDIGYGMTESSPVVSVALSGESPPGSVGTPLPGVDVAISGTGEILLRGRNVMRGYVGDARATAEALSDGWLHTGDRGHRDEAGFLYVTGRIKESMVTANGECLWPEEMEPCYEDPSFAEHCVIPMQDPDGNDLPTLVIVLKSVTTLDDREIEEIFRRLRAAAPTRSRVDRYICIPGPLPRTPTGKIRRRALADSLKQERT
jgi:long-chain acyl-CoA synthetase